MRWVAAALLLCATFVVVVQAQRPLSRKATFTSPDHTFRFEYRDTLVLCQRDPNQSDWWTPDASCEAYTPVCSDASARSEGTLACVAYPADDIKNRTNFAAAAFSVNELKAVKTKENCEIVAEPHVGSHTETIDGVNFKVTEIDGVQTGNLLHGYVYRTFHNGQCYELDLRIASSNIANYQPGTVRNFDSEKVRRALKVVLDSFKFLP